MDDLPAWFPWPLLKLPLVAVGRREGNPLKKRHSTKPFRNWWIHTLQSPDHWWKNKRTWCFYVPMLDRISWKCNHERPLSVCLPFLMSFCMLAGWLGPFHHQLVFHTMRSPENITMFEVLLKSYISSHSSMSSVNISYFCVFWWKATLVDEIWYQYNTIQLYNTIGAEESVIDVCKCPMYNTEHISEILKKYEYTVLSSSKFN